MRRLPLLVVFAFTLVGAFAPATLAAPAHVPSSSSAVSQLTIGSGSCTGAGACVGATGNIGDNSCTGTNVCANSHGNIGDSSCNGGGTKAIANINASLATWRWLDADSLNPVHGFRVFNKERHGITWLWTGVLLANPTWSAVANDAVNQLVAADREVVVTAIAESTDSAAIATANAKLAQADALLAQQQRGKAIYKLRAAWLAVN